MNNRGALSVPLLLSLLAVSLMGFGTWGVMRRLRHVTEIQLRLDRCVGAVALELQGAQTRIERANGRMRKLRLSNAPLSIIAPPIAAAIKAELTIEAGLQDFERLRWKTRQARWLVQRGCAEGRGIPVPLPGLTWTRPPSDPLGPQPLQWTGVDRNLKIGLYSSPRASAARVEAEPISLAGELIGEYSWKATWTRLGPSTY